MTVKELFLLLENMPENAEVTVFIECAERDYQAIAEEVLESKKYQAIEIRGVLKWKKQ